MREPARHVIRTEPAIPIDPRVHLWIGGPVEPQRTWVLMSEAQGPEDERREICPGVVLSVSPALTLQVLQQPPDDRARVLVGYAGWGPGQLEQEIAGSSWLTMDVDPALIFDVPAERMWEVALRRLGTDPAKLQMSPGVH